MRTARQGGHRGGRRSRLAALVVGGLLLAALGYHAAALTAYEAAAEPGRASARLAHARAAATLEPWDRRFAWRVVTLEGLALLEAGRVDDAYRLLEPLSQVVRDDALYRAVYQEVVAFKTPLDARKAHLQHAREQKGGFLREQDVFH